MHFDVKEIASAWIAKLHPTDPQKELAERRASICNECDEVGEIIEDNENTRYCKKCGCIIGAKIYSYKEGACPLGKWDDNDREFRNTQALKVLKNPNSKLI